MPTQAEPDTKKEDSLKRQRETRDRTKMERAVRDAERKALRGVRSSADRREIKGEFDDIRERMDNTQSSAGGSESGGVYDISTKNYTPPPKNQSGRDTNVTETGIHEVPRTSDAEISFNGSVLICINGTPYWIDIPYNGVPYDSTGDPNFEILEP